MSTTTSSASEVTRNYFLFRTCREIPLESGVVGMGWDDIEFRAFSTAECIIREITDVRHWNIGRRGEQIRRFKRIQKGDVIVAPFVGTAAIGLATGEEHYDPTYRGKNGCNQQRVHFYSDDSGKVKLLPRTNLSGALQARLKIRITIADLNGFKKEIDDAVSELEGGNIYSRSAQIEMKIAEQQQELRDQLLRNIRIGEHGLAGGGLGLERLVQELLQIDNFDAEALGKRSFPGEADADIRATRTSRMGIDGYLVQVKHHNNTTGSKGLRQLLEIHSLVPEYRSHQLVLVTSGDLSDEDREFAEANDIVVVDGRDLVDWICDSIPRLSLKSKLALGISEAPRVIL